MPKNKPTPLGIWVFTVAIFALTLYYYYPVYTGTFENMDSLTTISTVGILFWVDIFLTAILFISITYGFYHKKNWARLFTIFYLAYSAFWAIVMMFIARWHIFEHYFYFIFYVIFLMYFNLSYVKEYFVPLSEEREKVEKVAKTPEFFKYKGYILHKKDIATKSGGSRVFYFFSENVSEKGTPCKKPEGYIVAINKRTGIPYLKKKK